MSKPAYKTQQDHIEIEPHLKSFDVRQDRIPLRKGEAELVINNIRYPILDISPFGLSIQNTNSIKNSTSTQGEVYSGPLFIAKVDLKWIREENFSESLKTAFEIESDPISLDSLYGARDLNIILEDHANIYNNKDIEPEFQFITFQVQSWLSSLETKVNSLEIDSFSKSRSEIEAYEDIITHSVAQYIEKNIQPIYQRLESLCKKLNPAQVKQHFEYFRSMVGRQMFQSYYANRAFHKPRGYAGDFEMMRTVYHKERRGSHLFGRCIERYFTDVPEAQAVRNRGRYLQSKILETLQQNPKVKIVSVASGPAMEIQYLLKDNADKLNQLEIHLIDQDIEALKLSQRAIESYCRTHNLKTKIIFHHIAIKNIIESGLPIESADLIYTAGLFDYLSSPVAQSAAQKLFETLNPQGRLIIGNFDVSAPNRFGMALVTDWHLIYRTADELNQLFNHLGPLEIEQEPLGINLFAVLWK